MVKARYRKLGLVFDVDFDTANREERQTLRTEGHALCSGAFLGLT